MRQNISSILFDVFNECIYNSISRWEVEQYTTASIIIYNTERLLMTNNLTISFMDEVNNNDIERHVHVLSYTEN